MKKLLLVGLLVAGALGLSACSHETDNTLPPSPLVKVKQTLSAQQLWEENTGNGSAGYYLRLSPVAGDGMVFTASQNGQVTALNAQNGATVWAMNLGKTVTSGLGIGGGAIYVGTTGGHLIALNEKTGKQLWNATLSNQMLAAPLYTKGLVLVHTISGSLAAYSARTGARQWRIDQNVPSLTLHAAGQPQVAGDVVVAGFANGELVAASLYSGKIFWERHVAFPTGSNPVSQMVDITVNPVVVDGIVYVATYQGQIAAYSLDGGQMLWQHKISSYAGMAATTSQVFVSDADSNVWSFDEGTGAVDWKQAHLLGRKITGPVIYNGNLVVADGYGYLHFMSLADGHFVERIEIGAGALAKPIVYRGNLYVYTASGDLIALHAS